MLGVGRFYFIVAPIFHRSIKCVGRTEFGIGPNSEDILQEQILIERFFGILVEHFAGKFPFWISPYPVRILTVADRHSPFAHEMARKIRQAGIVCDIDESNESVGKKVRNAQLLKVNYMLTVGDKEVEHKTVALRTRDNVVHGEVDISDFLAKVVKEQSEKALMSPFSTAP